ncbi:MAG: MBL fold metallo-hydrolase [Minisyncoccia bacterium]
MRELKIPSIAALITLLLLTFVSFGNILKAENQPRMLEVTFLDVGQGDATFIESPTGTQVLIDGGKGSVVLDPLQRVMGFFDRDIDMVVATHPDMDHIGGLIDVLKRYNVSTILMTENTSDTPAFAAFLEQVKNEEAQILYARRGQVYDLGSGDAGSTTLSILFPDRNPVGLETNTGSIVARLVYGESEYLLTGDSPQEIEEYLVSIGTELQSDVLKAGHHGSRTSTGELYVNVVAPTYAIFSAGRDNSYGHPHKEVTDRFTAHDITQINTADRGSIYSETDGVTIKFK